MNSALNIIISREYLERVKRKSFIITTILTPLFMIALMVAPTLAAIFTGPESRTISVVDESGVVAQTLQNGDEIKFRPTDQSLEALKADEDVEAILVIGKDVVKKPQGNVALYTRGAASIQTEAFISNQLNRTIENQRIERYQIDNLAQIMKDVQVDVDLATYRIDKEEETSTSSMLSYALGMMMMFILYMFIIIYGQMVMTSIIEEKNNRVLELVVSSVKPTTLMMGKILGIGFVAITQVLIWAVLLIACAAWLMPMLAGLAVGSESTELMQAVAQLGNVNFLVTIFSMLLLFLIGGYLFYSAIYAAIGSAVDNVQDASQLQTVALMPILVGLVLSTTVVNDPNSTLAVWSSIIPLTSPMVMMARLPFGIPMWQVLLSVVLLYVGFMAMIWISAKIYRVGIFMYGKKPTFKELIKWTRYK